MTSELDHVSCLHNNITTSRTIGTDCMQYVPVEIERCWFNTLRGITAVLGNVTAREPLERILITLRNSPNKFPKIDDTRRGTFTTDVVACRARRRGAGKRRNERTTARKHRRERLPIDYNVSALIITSFVLAIFGWRPPSGLHTSIRRNSSKKRIAGVVQQRNAAGRR